MNYGSKHFVLFLTCIFEFGREYFTPLRRFAEERFDMTLFAKHHERRGYPAQGNAWSADRAAICPTRDLLVVRIRS